MPGIEIGAPERTDTSNGATGSSNRFPVAFLTPVRVDPARLTTLLKARDAVDNRGTQRL